MLDCFKTVTHPSKRYNASAVFAKALSEKLNVCVKRSFVTEEVVAPDLAYKLFTGECKSFVLYHIEKSSYSFGVISILLPSIVTILAEKSTERPSYVNTSFSHSLRSERLVNA